ncbi:MULTISPECIES: type II toxin-antitoxin system RelE/ParE family toxin [unclassified Thioalkalivibrio]|uniref:type II toxin-antitoxin system RelE family toxin n=1 Tax=unclassified Thioalkalivibrio TaxID=2621013 RepID=UPI0003618F45|nr:MULTISPECIES: type II toxin-antitoxin system RelE/ParE family toxin [unclassified Thioalkalivibrio]
MAWRIEYAHSTRKAVQKLDRKARQRIRQYLEERVAHLDDPRELGKPLKGRLTQLWRYRVGDYRVICELRDESLVVLVVRIGHRKEVYD